MEGMSSLLSADLDTAEVRKARGAFFTPEAITRFISDWAIRSSDDLVLEPSTGDAAFLVSAVERLRSLGGEAAEPPRVDGVEIHAGSAHTARSRIEEAGGIPRITISDFFRVEPQPLYSAVIGTHRTFAIKTSQGNPAPAPAKPP